VSDEPVVWVCPGQATTPEDRAALAELARAAVRAHEAELAAMTPQQRAAHDEWVERGRQRRERAQRRARE
jgi:hypothetical protein